MSAAKHTSGPWKVYHEQLRPQFPGNKIIEIQDNDGQPIVNWSGFDDSDRLKKTHLANARLMAAAPDMLKALQLTLGYLRRIGKDDGPCAAEIERVMHKASGALQQNENSQ